MAPTTNETTKALDLALAVEYLNGLHFHFKEQFDSGKGLGTGLSLVRSLLPEQGAFLTYTVDEEGQMVAQLRLTPPVIMANQSKAPA